MEGLKYCSEKNTLNNDIKNKNTYDTLKRIFDIICSLVSIIILIPVFFIIGILIKIESKGSVLFVQTRIGINGTRFKMYKFRSMVRDAERLKEILIDKNEMDGPMFKIKNDPRVTRIGRFIRRTSIDELPQLFNILRGEMSFVGPRPSLPQEVEQFEPWMKKRMEVKPGLTCLWQINGRNNTKFIEWMNMDIEYVKKRSLWLDIKLIFKTFFVFFGDKNAS